MNPGRLNHRITIRYLPMIDDKQGGKTTQGQVLTDLCTVWAEFWRPKATVDLQQGGFSSILTHTINIRFREDVQINYQVVDGSKIYKVLHVYPTGHDTTTLICQEVSRVV